MKNRLDPRSYRRAVLSLLVLAAITAIFALPFHFRSEAAVGLYEIERTESHEDGLPNYDIRTDKSAYGVLESLRSAAGKSASAVADHREAMVRGEDALRQRVPTLKIEYNEDIRIPEVIGPDVAQGRAFLTERSSVKRSDILKNFLNENAELVGARGSQISELKVFADYTNPNGILSFVELNQEINGIPVFRGEIKAGFTRTGEMVRVINNFAPGIEYSALSTDFGDPSGAVAKAAAYINNDGSRLDLRLSRSESTELKAVFGSGDWATTAEKMYFPTEPGVAVPAWRVLIWQPVNAYYVIVDSRTGAMLWRKNITEDQTQAATYNVYTNSNAMINVADNPFPMTPGPIAPNGTQSVGIPRTQITAVGNETPYQFNNNGWITDGSNTTDGNANAAGLDRDSANGIDGNGLPAGSPDRVFDYPISPGVPVNPAQALGDNPLPEGAVPNVCVGVGSTPEMIDFQRAAVTQLFYINNRYHAEMYLLGFTEQARNFQHNNFGRGGAANDRVSAEAQDCSGVNNANFSTPSDGNRGRMQMYIWTKSDPTPDFDGDLDADVIIHEFTHGLSNRLHGNGSGLSSNLSRAMGEGWSDFYGHALLSEPSDPIEGIYTTGAYDTYRSGAGFNNYYYGIRRFPKAVIAFTGGPNNRPHNPMTFADIDSTQQNLSDGAFSPRFNTTADQVHAAGEVWSSALWEVRAKYIQRLGWEVGNRLALQHITDGMKLAPLGPNFLTERDAIIAAGLAGGTADNVADMWSGFALRGMGFSASIQVAGSGSGTARVTEAFDLPNLLQTPQFGVSDELGDNDGSFEPGETLTLTVPLSNSTGTTATGVSLEITGGATADYGTIITGQTVTRVLQFVVPANTACGSALPITFNVESSLGPTNFTRTIAIGAPIITFTENFDGVSAPGFPAGWTAVSIAGGITFVTTTTGPDTAPNSAFALDPLTVGGGTDLTSPPIPITAAAGLVTFRNKYQTEAGWDGSVLEISVGGGPFQDILAAGGVFIQNGYNGSLGVGSNNPLNGRAAWTGNSGGYVTTIARLPANAAGQDVRLKFRFGADDNTAVVGWNVDTISVAGSYGCDVTPGTVRSRADFDGDGKTDLSVFRPSEGNWYLNGSTDGFTARNFGLGGDVPVPGDYDNDGKADIAVFRPAADGSLPDFYVLNSATSTFSYASWGIPGDIPLSGDVDGDGLTDFTVFRPEIGTWFVLKSGGGAPQADAFGAAGDIPMYMDFDGNGRSNYAVFRPGTGVWYIAKSSGVPAQNFDAVTFGLPTDSPVPADYDGDNKEDIAVFRGSTGTWYIRQSSNGEVVTLPFGLEGDIPVPGDYDGDGRDDIAVFRGGIWYLNQSTAGPAGFGFGVSTDIPIPSKYIP